LAALRPKEFPNRSQRRAARSKWNRRAEIKSKKSKKAKLKTAESKKIEELVFAFAPSLLSIFKTRQKINLTANKKNRYNSSRMFRAEEINMEVSAYLYDASGKDERVELTDDICDQLNDKKMLWVDVSRRERETVERVAKALTIEKSSARAAHKNPRASANGQI
jgi:hypothetical protein